MTLNRKLTTDKDGAVVTRQCTEFMEQLYKRTNCADVWCHDHQTEKVGYKSKRSSAGIEVFAIARRYGFDVHLTSSREGNAYVEFKPQEESR